MSEKVYKNIYRNVDKSDIYDIYSMYKSEKYDIGEDMEYTGMMRTRLSTQERKELRKLASSKGMTLVGFCDAVLRGEIEKKELTTKEAKDDSR